MRFPPYRFLFVSDVKGFGKVTASPPLFSGGAAQGYGPFLRCKGCCASRWRATACGRPLTPEPRRPLGAGKTGRPGLPRRRAARNLARGVRKAPGQAEVRAGTAGLVRRELPARVALERPGCGRRVGAGPGVAWPKSRSAGCKPATLASESSPGCPPRPAAARRASAFIRW
jgi:hypothetical protein